MLGEATAKHFCRIGLIDELASVEATSAPTYVADLYLLSCLSTFGHSLVRQSLRRPSDRIYLQSDRLNPRLHTGGGVAG